MFHQVLPDCPLICSHGSTSWQCPMCLCCLTAHPHVHLVIITCTWDCFFNHLMAQSQTPQPGNTGVLAYVTVASKYIAEWVRNIKISNKQTCVQCCLYFDSYYKSIWLWRNAFHPRDLIDIAVIRTAMYPCCRSFCCNLVGGKKPTFSKNRALR